MNLLKIEEQSDSYFNADTVAVVDFGPDCAVITMIGGARFNVSHPDSLALLRPAPKQPVRKTRKKSTKKD